MISCCLKVYNRHSYTTGGERGQPLTVMIKNEKLKNRPGNHMVTTAEPLAMTLFPERNQSFLTADQTSYIIEF